MAVVIEWLFPKSVQNGRKPNREIAPSVTMSIQHFWRDLLPRSCQKEWADQAFKTEYRSYANGQHTILENDLAVRHLKRVLEPKLFLTANTTADINDSKNLFPQYRGLSKVEGQDKLDLEKSCKQAGVISGRMIREVGTAILMYIVQEERFCQHPLPPFENPKQRKDWFERVLTEKPLLCIIFIYSLYGLSIDVPLIYSEWTYNDKLNTLKRNIQQLVLLRLSCLLERIFQLQFNVPRAHPIVVIDESCRRRITKHIKMDFGSETLKYLQHELNDIPITHSWPKSRCKAPWFKLLGGEWANAEEAANDDDENDDGTAGNKRLGNVLVRAEFPKRERLDED